MVRHALESTILILSFVQPDTKTIDDYPTSTSVPYFLLVCSVCYRFLSGFFVVVSATLYLVSLCYTSYNEMVEHMLLF